jgi:fructose-1,6-bisphosphatase/inositol monophosphatase family enzyme
MGGRAGGLTRLIVVLDAAGVREVDRLIRSTAEHEILPRFRRLAAADIAEKRPGDMVTVADRAAEERLAVHLSALVPGSVVLGEEAVSADPAVMDLLDGDAPVWIVDPIDGTHNFIAHSPRFMTLVALAQHGELLASWSYAPTFGTMAIATAGGGAHVDGERVRVGPAPRVLRYLDVIACQDKWWSYEQREMFHALLEHGVSFHYFDLSSFEYVELASGRRTAMVLTWELPWDHAAGLLLYAEAGGAVITHDGAPFRLAGGNAMPFVAAPDVECAMALHAALAGQSPSRRR